jgi:hypothetical protein
MVELGGPVKILARTSFACFGVVLGLASSADAAPVYYGAYVHGSINNESCNFGAGPRFIWGDPGSCSFSGTDPRFFAPNLYGPVSYVPFSSATDTHGDGDESIWGSANLATGDLSVGFWSTGSSWSTQVTALMWETLTFHFADSAQHLISVTMAGQHLSSATHAWYKLEVFQPPDPNLYPQTLMMQGVTPLPDGPYSATASMWVNDGMTVAVLAGLTLYGEAGQGGVAWDPLVFDLGGGSFTSSSGLFLTQTPSAPEPTTLLLLGTALAAGVRRLIAAAK